MTSRAHTSRRRASQQPRKSVTSCFCLVLHPAGKIASNVKCYCETVDKCERGEVIFGKVGAALNHQIWGGGVTEIRQQQWNRLCGSFLVATINLWRVSGLWQRSSRRSSFCLLSEACGMRANSAGWGWGGVPSLLKTCQMPRDLISVSFSQWATVQWPCQRQKAEERDTPL